jgi:hypothetical protein
VLDGTTLEEIEKYHRNTLKLVVTETNRQYKELRSEQAAAEKRRWEQEDKHRQEIERRARDIKFD